MRASEVAIRYVLGLIVGIFLATAAPAAEFRLLRINGFHLKWGDPVAGRGAVVTYGLADRSESFAAATNCARMAPASVLADEAAIPADRLDGIVAAAFEMWAGVAGIVFRPAGPGERPDILIGAQGRPHRIAFANVWWDEAAAANRIAPLTRATVCLNPRVRWRTVAAAPPAQDAVDLRFALAHEIGHAIGLDHPGATGALMGYRSPTGVDRLMPGDIAGAVALYGLPVPR